MIQLPDAATAEKSAAWKRENAEYLHWFSNQHPDELVIEDAIDNLKVEWKAIGDNTRALGWDAFYAIVPLVVFIGGLIYAVFHHVNAEL